MKPGNIVLAGAGAIMLAGTAHADLTGTRITLGARQHPGSGIVTYRLHLAFDDARDQLVSIGADADISPLVFQTDGAALQQNCTGSCNMCDIQGPFDGGGDSWIALGDQNADVSYSPAFLVGCTCPCIGGNFFSQADNGGYFDQNLATPALPDANGLMRIAQFSLPSGTCFTYRGTASYLDGGEDFRSEAFFFEICGCAGDLDASGAVDFGDVVSMLANWGPYAPCPPASPWDIDKDCTVGFSDLLALLANWGGCDGGGDPYACAEPGACGEGFPECGGADCVCFQRADGGTLCLDRFTPCAGLVACPNGQDDCPPDEVCVVDSCCVQGDAVCIPEGRWCRTEGAAPVAPPERGTATITGIRE